MRSLILFALGLFSAQMYGQSGSPVSAMPSDPQALALLTSRSNGLAGLDIHPWHLKAKFQLLKAPGNDSNEGTIEEFWASPQKIRLTYTAKDFSRTTYWTDAGVLQSGPADLPSYLIMVLRTALVEPMPPPDFLQGFSFETQERDLGAVKLNCLTARVATPPNFDRFQKTLGPTYCVNTDKPVLRIRSTGQGSNQILGNKITAFQGRYVPQDIKIVHEGQNVANLQVETLEGIQSLDDTLFAPSADAKLIPPTLALPSGIASGMLVAQQYPHYPIAAKQSHTQGTVVLDVVVGKNGKISNLKVASGPIQLREAATDAVKQWVYWPCFVDGQAVEVNTKVNVVFNIGN